MNELIRHEQRLIGSFVYSADQFNQAIELAACADPRWVASLDWRHVPGVLRDFGEGTYQIVRAALRPALWVAARLVWRHARADPGWTLPS